MKEDKKRFFFEGKKWKEKMPSGKSQTEKLKKLLQKHT